MVSTYRYTYDDKGFIIAETAIESLAGYAYDEKHDGKHEDGKHDALYPHGNNHNGKHDKDATFAYQIVQVDRPLPMTTQENCYPVRKPRITTALIPTLTSMT